MQYLLLIYENEAGRQNIDRSKMMDEYGTFTKSIIESGNFKAGDALQPTSTATTVRVKDCKPMTTHGPFAETREALIGYYLGPARMPVNLIQESFSKTQLHTGYFLYLRVLGENIFYVIAALLVATTLFRRRELRVR